MTWLAVGAGVGFGAALSFLTLFFKTKVERYDRIAEWCFVAFAALAIPTALNVAGRFPDGGLTTPIATIAGVGGAAFVGLGELATTLKLIDFRRISAFVTLAFLAFLLWIGMISVLIVAQGGGLPAGLGWLGVVSILLGIGIVLWIVRVPGVINGEVEPPQAQMVAFAVPMAGIVAWMVWLGLSL